MEKISVKRKIVTFKIQSVSLFPPYFTAITKDNNSRLFQFDILPDFAEKLLLKIDKWLQFKVYEISLKNDKVYKLIIEKEIEYNQKSLFEGDSIK